MADTHTTSSNTAVRGEKPKRDYGAMSKSERRKRRDEELRRRLGCPFLDEDEAAAYLLLSASTLAQLRVSSGGPDFRKHAGRVAYLIEDLEKWSDARKRRSTSDIVDEPAGVRS